MGIDFKAVVESYQNYSNWNTAAAKAMYEATSEEELNESMQKLGQHDFQRGNDYGTALFNLSMGEIFEGDTNGDMSIDYNESLQQGRNELKGVLDEKTIDQIVGSDAVMMDLYAVDMNIDDKKDLDELMVFYSMADESLPGEENVRVKDGRFSQEDLAQAQETLLSMLMEENPELEEQLMGRFDEIYGYLTNILQ